MQIMNAKGHLGPPLVLYSRPPFKLDLETHSPTPQGYRVFGVHPWLVPFNWKSWPLVATLQYL